MSNNNIEVPEGFRLVRDHRVVPSVEDERGMDRSYDFDKQAEAVAAERGQIVVWPEPNELQLDIDSDDQLHELERRLDSMGISTYRDKDFWEGFRKSNNPDSCYIHTKPSKTEGHYHVSLFFGRTFTEAERIVFQFAMGSDYLREMLNAFRLWQGVDRPTRLFETPSTPLVNEKEEFEKFIQEL